MQTRSDSFSRFVISRTVLGGREYWNRYRKQWMERSRASRFLSVSDLLAYVAKEGSQVAVFAGNRCSIVKLTTTTTTRTHVRTRVTSQKLG